MLELLRKSVIS